MHLDSEYRRRWQEFHLKNGEVFDSRVINWRDIEWENIQKIVTNIEGKTYEITVDDKQDFICLMCFRWGGREAVFDDNGDYERHIPICIWTFGWTDGKMHYLTDVDFYTGDFIKKYTAPFKEFKNHIHPRITI
jgi:hypothetical protein